MVICSYQLRALPGRTDINEILPSAPKDLTVQQERGNRNLHLDIISSIAEINQDVPSPIYQSKESDYHFVLDFLPLSTILEILKIKESMVKSFVIFFSALLRHN